MRCRIHLCNLCSMPHFKAASDMRANRSDPDDCSHHFQSVRENPSICPTNATTSSGSRCETAAESTADTATGGDRFGCGNLESPLHV
mmetsp:Transcript_39347/g.85959  ORF Transcript_39347/g.85959 Transcript_39347/m.85959 type:complete len:87 (+) Transcript_39347:1744-2004(+)